MRKVDLLEKSNGDLETSTGVGIQVFPEASASEWVGTTIADQVALRNFYGDQTVTIAGANFTAKGYPDGSVTGSTDNGKFEMKANGEISMNHYVTIGAIDSPSANPEFYKDYDWYKPIETTSGQHSAISQDGRVSSLHGTSAYVKFRAYNVNSGSHADTKILFIGRWKA